MNKSKIIYGILCFILVCWLLTVFALTTLIKTPISYPLGCSLLWLLLVVVSSSLLFAICYIKKKNNSEINKNIPTKINYLILIIFIILGLFRFCYISIDTIRGPVEVEIKHAKVETTTKQKNNYWNTGKYETYYLTGTINGKEVKLKFPEYKEFIKKPVIKNNSTRTILYYKNLKIVYDYE